MRLYVDASAATKLFADEDESAALHDYLTHHGSHLVSSVILETEMRRTATRKSAPQTDVTSILARIDLLAAPRQLFQEAGLLPFPDLRTLDALHIATAMRAGADAFLAYDRRLLDAAGPCGFLAVTPA